MSIPRQSRPSISTPAVIARLSVTLTPPSAPIDAGEYVEPISWTPSNTDSTPIPQAPTPAGPTKDEDAEQHKFSVKEFSAHSLPSQGVDPREVSQLLIGEESMSRETNTPMDFRSSLGVPLHRNDDSWRAGGQEVIGIQSLGTGDSATPAADLSPEPSLAPSEAALSASTIAPALDYCPLDSPAPVSPTLNLNPSRKASTIILGAASSIPKLDEREEDLFGSDECMLRRHQVRGADGSDESVGIGARWRRGEDVEGENDDRPDVLIGDQDGFHRTKSCSSDSGRGRGNAVFRVHSCPSSLGGSSSRGSRNCRCRGCSWQSICGTGV